MNIHEIIAENDRRRNRLKDDAAPVVDTDGPIDVERCKSDFGYWAARAVVIRDKTSGRNVPFVLNRAQRRVLGILEDMRTAGRPIRLIMLKARQWGGSTLVQVYMAWIQLVHCRNWHSVICAHVQDASRTIRGMYTNLLDNYPAELTDPDGPPLRFAGFERAQNVRVITGRDCRVTVASAEAQNSVRGSDIAMAHLSEVAFWKATPTHDPEDFLRAVCGSVPLVAMSLVAIESTANGVGNFFHREWMRAEKGESDKVPVFVPWYEIDIYTLPVDNYGRLWESLTPYELRLWHDHGCTLEQINWYRKKLAEYPKIELMHAEFPTTAEEAFVSSDANVFSNKHIEALRAGCRQPVTGELNNAGCFVETSHGCLDVWEAPLADASYIVTVDVGGRSSKADYSVIAVLRADVRPEVVAQWRGHIDHDLLAARAMAIATHYNEALLVIESNTLETADESSVSASVLYHVGMSYPMVYRRPRRAGSGTGIGFHTNRHTKTLAIDALIAAVRDGTYVERDDRACDELATYCRRPNGTYEARRGCHDDILMTRAIALYVLAEQSPLFATNPSADPLPPYLSL